MVQVTVCGRRQLERAEADVVEGLVVDAEGLVSVLDKLVDGQRRVVRFYYGVGHFRRGDHAECVHDSGET